MALSKGLQRIATTAGIYNAFRNRTFPVQDKRVLPLTEVPEVRSLGVTALPDAMRYSSSN